MADLYPDLAEQLPHVVKMTVCLETKRKS